MSVRTIGAILLAVLCGGSVAIAVTRMTAHVEAGTAVKTETDPVVVAAVIIPRGKKIEDKDITITFWPRGLVPKTGITKREQAVGCVAMSTMVVDEPLMDHKLASKEAGGGLAPLIPMGMRAFTIQASRAACNVAGFIMPGHKVDVLLNLRGGNEDGTGGAATTTLLQSVEVLAVDQNLEAPSDKVDFRSMTSVTLLVSPMQAKMLDLAQNMGQLTLALRNMTDVEEADTPPATMLDIRLRQQRPLLAGGPNEASGGAVADSEVDAQEEHPILTLRGVHRGRVMVSRSLSRSAGRSASQLSKESAGQLSSQLPKELASQAAGQLPKESAGQAAGQLPGQGRQTDLATRED